MLSYLGDVYGSSMASAIAAGATDEEQATPSSAPVTISGIGYLAGCQCDDVPSSTDPSTTAPESVSRFPPTSETASPTDEASSDDDLSGSAANKGNGDGPATIPRTNEAARVDAKVLLGGVCSLLSSPTERSHFSLRALPFVSPPQA